MMTREEFEELLYELEDDAGGDALARECGSRRGDNAPISRAALLAVYDAQSACIVDLLAACEAMVEFNQNFGLVPNELDADDTGLYDALVAMQAAIAKARGEAADA